MRFPKIRTVIFPIIAVLFVLTNLNNCLASGDKVAGQLSFLKSKQILKTGMSGREIFELQIYLAELSIYPKNLITGYFGRVTELAVKIFQLKNGIEAVGIVGPKTKKKIADLVASSSIDHLPQPLLVATSSQIGNIIINTAIGPEIIKYNLPRKSDYDLKKLAKNIQNLVNDKRGEVNLSPVYWDDELAEVALEHSLDQAKDNLELTNPAIVCHYPIIRHEGFTVMGYSLRDRYSSRNINYRYGGENIAMIPVSKNLLYVELVSDPSIKCRDAPKFLPGDGAIEVRTDLFRKVLNSSRDAVRGLKPVEWSNREWRGEKELTEMAVGSWMNSPGHKENILRKDFTVGGIGIASVNDYIIITHDFVGR